MEGANDYGVLILKHTYFCLNDFVSSGMIGDDEVNVIDGVEYLPEQKPAEVWTTFSPKIQSKITLRNTRLLRRRSSDLLGTPTDNDDAGDVLHQAVLSPPPRVKRNGAHKSLQIEFRPMLTEMYEEHRARNRQAVQELNLRESPVHQHRRPWSKGLSRKEISSITTADFDYYNQKLAVQINCDFPERISTKKYEKNKELVNLIIAEEVRAAKKKETRDVYLEHKNRLKELRMSAKDRTKLLVQRLKHEAQKKQNDFASDVTNDSENIRKRRNQKNRGQTEPLLMIGKNRDKPVYGFRQIEEVDASLKHDLPDDVSNIELVRLCANIRQNREHNLAKMKKAAKEFRLADSEWERVRRDPKYLLGKRFDKLKSEATNTLAAEGESLKFDPMFEMSEEDIKRWIKLKKAPAYRANKMIQKKAREAREKASNSIYNYQIQRALKK